jgi:hypothetical protein
MEAKLKPSEKDVIQCPACTAENPKGRVTCVVCHSPLYKGLMKEVPGVAKKEIPKDKQPEAQPRRREKKEPMIVTKEVIKEPITKGMFTDTIPLPTRPLIPDPPKEKPVKEIIHRVRSPRKKTIKPPIESQMFVLQGGRLTPVTWNLKLTPVRGKKLVPAARSLIDLWNHNKGLLAK